METDSHNQRHKSYRGTCRTVTTATGRAGGHHQQLSEIGCWWFGATVQLSWLFCPPRHTESGSLVSNLPWSGGSRNTMDGREIHVHVTNHMGLQNKHVWLNYIKAIPLEKHAIHLVPFLFNDKCNANEDEKIKHLLVFAYSCTFPACSLCCTTVVSGTFSWVSLTILNPWDSCAIHTFSLTDSIWWIITDKVPQSQTW